MGCSHAKLCCCRCPSSNSRRPSAAAASAAAASDSVRPSSRLFLTGSTIGTATIPSAGLLLRYSTLSQRGHYPGSPYRENQDCFLVRTHLQSRPDAHLFAVFDGHGQFGAQCAAFTRDRLVDVLTADPALFDDPPKAYASAFAAVNSDLHASGIDDTMSGTTGIAVLVAGDTMWVANVGDSRAVAGVLKDGAVLAEELSRDQTPFRKDEYERVRRCGARVLSVDQVEGIKDPEVQSWGDEESDEGDPPRLWVQNGKYPGTAFTRSIGDSTAEGIGVIAEPEVLRVKISPDHLFFVVASDGVFEFLSSQAVVEMVAKFMDPRDACSAIAAASYKIWLEHESRTDDITLIVVHIKDLCDSGAEVTDTSSLTGSESLVVSDKENDGVPAPQRSATCHQGATNLFKMQYHPVDISMEWNSARVASSPKCSAVRNG